MSKIVKFDVDGYDKSLDVMDTVSNVKLVAAGLGKMYKAMDKVDKEKKDQARFLDYFVALQPVLNESVGTILGLSKTELKKLENVSYYDQEKFYSDLCDQFLGLQMPSARLLKQQYDEAVANATAIPDNDEVETVDPKPTEEK
ncbi:phage tail tube assembly chaperone [Lactobacillus intestinalis]|uniref:phage tail tube assembly chaperone n=1 Tax=Lactobacillus intestinalis TaxID=151781 RepID=UPI00266EEF30|nr:phage tail tube assembly chaperone [Lactobacillus intestinalis]